MNMSSQSGIFAEAAVLDAINEMSTLYSSVVAVIDQKENTKIKLEAKFHDLKSLREFLFSQDSNACYIIVNDDAKFVFISFTPDCSSVKSKMLYASSKIGFQRQIGLNNLKSFMFTNVDEIDESSWNEDQSKTAVLIDAEREKIEIDSQQSSIRNTSTKLVSAECGPDSVGFKLKDDGLHTFPTENNFVVFSVDETSEEIKISKALRLDSSADLLSAIPGGNPSYSLYNAYGKNFFILSCPSGSIVRERMLYATNKKQLLRRLQEDKKIDLKKSFEIGDICELDLSELEEHDPTEDTSRNRKNKLNKPRAPSRRR